MLRTLLVSTVLPHVSAKVQMVLIQKQGWSLRNSADRFRDFNCLIYHQDPAMPMRWQGISQSFLSEYWTEGSIHPVQQAGCDDSDHFQFLISDEQVTTIRPALRPDLCAEAPATIAGPSFLRFNQCHGFSNQSFTLPRLSTFYRRPSGSICTASNPDCCVGEFQTIESCLNQARVSQAMNCYIGVIGISNINEFNASLTARNVQTSWHIITAHPKMWFGSRVTEAVVFKAMLCYLICCAAGYAAYVLWILVWFICKAWSSDAPISSLRKKLVEAKSLSNRAYQAFGALCDMFSSTTDVNCLVERRRLQRAQLYSRKLLHASSIYAVVKARQLWQEYTKPQFTECSDLLSACGASLPRMHIYDFEMIPFFTMIYPVLVGVTLLGDKHRSWFCNISIAILSMGWAFRGIIDSARFGGRTVIKELSFRVFQIIIFGNPRLVAVFEVFVYCAIRAHAYGVCFGTAHGLKSGASDDVIQCPDTQHILSYLIETTKGMELAIVLFAAGCVYVFDNVQAKEITATRRGDARELALRMLQSHLDVLYDCVVHLGENFEVSNGAPKLACLLMRGAINEHSLKDRYLTELMAEGDRQRFVQHMKNTCLSDRVSVLHVSFVDGGGSVVPCELFSSSAIDDQGTRTFMLGIKEVEREGEPPTSQGHATHACPPTTRMFNDEVEKHIDGSSDRSSGSGARDRGAIDEQSNSSASQSEASREEVNLRLAVNWGQDENTTVASCTQQLSIALGKNIEGAPLLEVLTEPSEFDEWLQMSVYRMQTGLDVPSLKAFLSSSRWRPPLSAMFFIEDISPIVDGSRRISLIVRRLRMEANKVKRFARPPPMQRKSKKRGPSISL